MDIPKSAHTEYCPNVECVYTKSFEPAVLPTIKEKFDGIVRAELEFLNLEPALESAFCKIGLLQGGHDLGELARNETAMAWVSEWSDLCGVEVKIEPAIIVAEPAIKEFKFEVLNPYGAEHHGRDVSLFFRWDGFKLTKGGEVVPISPSSGLNPGIQDPNVIVRILKSYYPKAHEVLQVPVMDVPYVGIDYGRLTNTNRNVETGIHYGVISSNTERFCWWEVSEPEYGPPCCPECGEEGEEGWQFCPLHGDELSCGDEPVYSGLINDTEFLAHSGECGEVWIERSPFFTFCGFCSPCAPGAGDLNSPVNGGIKTYCPPPDWFEEGKIPFDIYSVSSGALVYAKTLEVE